MTVPTETIFESTEGMTDTCRTGLRNLLLAAADTKLLLAYHYGEWTFGPPELEAAIASCSLAQSELGHVRLLHAILRKHYDDDPDRLVDERPASAFANITFLNRPIADWAEYVAMNYAVDLAVTRLLHGMKGSSFKPIRMSIDKMLDEERYHIHHGHGWLRTLAGRDDASRQAVSTALYRAIGAVVEWYGPPDEAEDLALVAAGVKAQSNTALRDAYLEDITQTMNGLALPVEMPTIESFEGWEPDRRRRDAAGPDEDILYHLRGSKNAMFKLT